MKYYNGNELKWSTDDVMLNAEHLDVKLTEEEAESILIATFEDNEAIMQFLNEEITDSILTFNALKTNKLKDNELH